MNTISDCEECKKRQFNKDRVIYREEIQKVNNNGNVTIYERENIPVVLVSGEDACLEIFSDITKRVRLQNQLLQSEKLATIGEMAAVIAHEIRNSLTSANMLLQLIQEAKVLKDPEKESMEVALSAIDRINKVTQDLLAFARPAEIHKEPTDLQTVIKESAAMYKHHFESKGIKLDIQSQNDLPLAQIDHKLMQDVFNNILLNSSQAIEQNGSIQVIIEKIPFKTEIREKFASVNIEIDETHGTQQKQQKFFRISFQDDGPGCTSEKLTKIFDPFYTTKINGTGLGLSMAKRVVDLHGGVIYAISKTGQGMQVNILIPIEASS
jgi:signal transduction histidine kinase